MADLPGADCMKKTRLAYVVEDDSITALLTEVFLKRALDCCNNVEHYADGQQAFDQLMLAERGEGRVPDLILLDLNMPFMDGWDFLEAFKGLNMSTDVPIFLLTSSIRPDDQERARRYQTVRGYFTKPLDDAKVAQIKQLLDNPAVCS